MIWLTDLRCTSLLWSCMPWISGGVSSSSSGCNCALSLPTVSGWFSVHPGCIYISTLCLLADAYPVIPSALSERILLLLLTNPTWFRVLHIFKMRLHALLQNSWSWLFLMIWTSFWGIHYNMLLYSCFCLIVALNQVKSFMIGHMIMTFSCLSLASAAGWRSTKLDGWAAIGCFGTEAEVWNLLMVVESEGRMRAWLRCLLDR